MDNATVFGIPEESSLFSVVIPTTNSREAFLSQCLESVIEQTLQPSEIVIVNNGLDSVKVPKSDIPIRIIETVFKAGVAQARNIGCTLSQSPYVVFLDDDDLLSQDYLELMAVRIQKEFPDCLVARLDQLVGERIVPYKNAHGSLRKDVIFLRNPGITGSSVVVKREAFFRAGGYNPGLIPSEDKALVLEMIRQEFSVVSAPECQAIIRQHSGVRLTTASGLRNGILAFYRLYRSEMSFLQRAYNLYKVVHYSVLAKIGGK